MVVGPSPLAGFVDRWFVTGQTGQGSSHVTYMPASSTKPAILDEIIGMKCAQSVFVQELKRFWLF